MNLTSGLTVAEKWDDSPVVIVWDLILGNVAKFMVGVFANL